MTKLVRYDQKRGIRLELDQRKIQETALALIRAVKAAVAIDPALGAKLSPLLDYAQLGLEGRILHPRSWDEDPLRYEFREDLLPIDVIDAYGRFTYYTQGSVGRHPTLRTIADQIFVEVDS